MSLGKTALTSRAGWIALRVALLALFVAAVARFWHPYYGFTVFLQVDPDAATRVVPGWRAAPIFVHPGPGSYDGSFYAQIASDPTLRDPALRPAVDDLGYRARRILLSAVAWALGGGDAVAAARAYAWLNLAAWLALAGVLWRVLPPTGWRETAAWAGVLFGAGALLSVRLALTDLPALLGVVLAVDWVERRRRPAGAGALAMAALSRETALLGAVALAPAQWRERGAWSRALLVGAAAALPLALWTAYVVATVGASGGGIGNFAAPFVGWGAKLAAVVRTQATEPYHALALASLLGHLALAVQWIFLATRRDWASPWWRLGAAYAAFMLVLGPAVWGEDLPGASVRVLLPMSVAFNVVAARCRAQGAWLLTGNLLVAGGVVALWLVPTTGRDYAAGRENGVAYCARAESGWYGVERRSGAAWMWCAREASLQIETWPRAKREHRLEATLKAFTPREVEIRAGGRVLWRGVVGREKQRIEFAADAPEGRVTLDFLSTTPPVPESTAPGARELGFALYGVRVLD